MKSKNLFLTLVVFPILLMGCKAAPTASNSPTQEPSAQKEDQTDQLATILSAGGSARCIMSKADGTSEVSYTIKGKKMRMEGMAGSSQQNNGTVINDGTYLYIWEKGKTEGIKSKIPSQQEMESLKEKSKSTMQNAPDLSDTAVRKEYEDQGYRIDCQPATVADSDFIPPTTVTFTDTSALMENAVKMMQEQSKELTPEQQAQMEQYLNQNNR